jgi:hypothetical protein
MSPSSDSGTILVCYDGSDGSREGLQSVSHLLSPRELVILTVWQSLATRLAASGGFGAFALNDEDQADSEEEQAARDAAEDGARRAREPPRGSRNPPGRSGRRSSTSRTRSTRS